MSPYPLFCSVGLQYNHECLQEIVKNFAKDPKIVCSIHAWSKWSVIHLIFFVEQEFFKTGVTVLW